jgi:hypothetical protein
MTSRLRCGSSRVCAPLQQAELLDMVIEGGEMLEIVANDREIGIKAKVENKGQYDQYLEELKPLREELGVSLKEDLYPEGAK